MRGCGGSPYICFSQVWGVVVFDIFDLSLLLLPINSALFALFVLVVLLRSALACCCEGSCAVALRPLVLVMRVMAVLQHGVSSGGATLFHSRARKPGNWSCVCGMLGWGKCIKAARKLLEPKLPRFLALLEQGNLGPRLLLWVLSKVSFGFLFGVKMTGGPPILRRPRTRARTARGPQTARTAAAPFVLLTLGSFLAGMSIYSLITARARPAVLRSAVFGWRDLSRDFAGGASHVAWSGGSQVGTWRVHADMAELSRPRVSST